MQRRQKEGLEVSRREMLIMSSGFVTALMLGNMSRAGLGHAAEIKFPEGKCTGKMEKKVLVTYASKYGSTGGVADVIAKELCARGVSADVALIRNARNIGSYQGVVIGSAIYMGQWMSEAVDFVKKNKEVLRRVPVAYFLVCMTLSRPTEKTTGRSAGLYGPHPEGSAGNKACRSWNICRRDGLQQPVLDIQKDSEVQGNPRGRLPRLECHPFLGTRTRVHQIFPVKNPDAGKE